MRIIIILSVILLAPAVSFSDTIRVPDDFNKIQDAIYAAADGDTVLVAPGTYVEKIKFKGKAITVKSEQGPVVTVIDGNQAGTVIRFEAGEDTDSILQGFTITNGTGFSHSGHSWGGGIYCVAASPTIRDNFIVGNTAMADYGGGGGIFCCDHCSPIIRNNIISGNTSCEEGGGIYYYLKCNPIIENNIITNNEAYYNGGGISCWNSSPAITNNIIANNTAHKKGGGIMCWHCTSEITNNTLYGNSANYGGGIWIGRTSATVVNDILWNNKAGTGPEIWIGIKDFPSTVTISHSDVEGGQPFVHVEPGSILNWKGGMIDADPHFVDPAKADYHLTFLSPCRASGDNYAVTELYDFERDPRIAYGTVDMGADEFYTHLYCTGDATPGGSVELKFTDLPGASPVGLWMAFNALEIPVSGAYGDWWLLPPMVGSFDHGSIPANGVSVLLGTIPSSPTSPYTLYFQAIMGTPLKLSNLCTMEVK